MKTKLIATIIITGLVLGAIWKYVPDLRWIIGLMVSIGTLIIALRGMLGETLKMGIALFGAIGLIVSIVIGVNKFPNPDRTLEELTPCREVIKRIDAIEEELNELPNDQGCLTADINDFNRVLNEHTDEWTGSDGLTTNWAGEQLRYLFPQGNVNQPDLNSFRWIRTFYEEQRGKYLTITKWKLDGSILVVGVILSIIGGLVAKGLTFTKLAPLAQIGFPLIVGLAILLGLGGFYFRFLGIMPSTPEIDEPIKNLFWTGFKIHFGVTIALIIVNAIKGITNEIGSGWIWTLILDALFTVPILFTYGNYIVNQTVAENVWLSNTTGTNALMLGFLFSSGLVGLIISFFPDES